MKQHVSPELRRDFWEEIPVPKPKFGRILHEVKRMMKSRAFFRCIEMELPIEA